MEAKTVAETRVESERLRTGERYHIASAYLTYVALDDYYQPQAVPGLIPETETEKRRNREAQTRRKTRLEEKRQETACQDALCG